MENMSAFTHDEVNCWDYCAMWSRHVEGAEEILGSDLEEFNKEELTTSLGVARKFRKYEKEWDKIEEPVDHCLVIIRQTVGLHTGIYHGGYIHHMSEAANSQRIEPVANYEGRIVGYYTRKI